MAEITIRLVYDPVTGKRDVHIGYESEDDALPIEHERAHRRIVESLLGRGILRADEVGRVTVQRGQAAPESLSEDHTPPRSESESS